MLIAIGNKVYDSEDVVITIMLTDQDKDNLANISPDCYFISHGPQPIPDHVMRNHKRNLIYHKHKKK